MNLPRYISVASANYSPNREDLEFSSVGGTSYSMLSNPCADVASVEYSYLARQDAAAQTHPSIRDYGHGNIRYRLVGSHGITEAEQGTNTVSNPRSPFVTTQVPQMSPEAFSRFLESCVVYPERLRYLRQEAEEEGIEFNEASVIDFYRFVDLTDHNGIASLILTDEGNTRAVWRTGPDNHFALDFLGDGHVHYVIFKLKPGDTEITRVADAVTIEELRQLIDDFHLQSLV